MHLEPKVIQERLDQEVNPDLEVKLDLLESPESQGKGVPLDHQVQQDQLDHKEFLELVENKDSLETKDQLGPQDPQDQGVKKELQESLV